MMITRIAAAFATLVILFATATRSFSQTASLAAAQALFQQRQWGPAADAFDKVEKAQPGATDALLYRGKCLVNLDRWSEAAASLENYIGGHEQSDDAVYLLAYVRFREDKPADSLRLYTQAAKLKSPTADDLKIVALDYVLLNDYSDAGHYLELALKMDPGNTEALYHLGRVRYQQNRFDDAIAAFQEVLKREPFNAKAEDNLGLSLEAKNEVGPAIAVYQKAIDMDKAASTHSEQPYLNLGSLLSKSNRAPEAVPLLQSAEHIAPKSAKVRYELGKTYFNLGRTEDARGEAEEAVRLKPEDASAHYLLGRIYHRLGKSDLEAKEFALTEGLIRAKGGTGMASGADNR